MHYSKALMKHETDSVSTNQSRFKTLSLKEFFLFANPLLESTELFPYSYSVLKTLYL